MKNIVANRQADTVKPTYMSLANDDVFKNVFGEQKELMIVLLNTIIKFENPITDLEFLPQESASVGKNGKKSVCDVRCKLSSGEHVIIEVQVNYEACFNERVVYEACMDIALQLKKSGKKHDEVYRLDPVYVISIVHFPRKHDKSAADKKDDIVWEYDINNPETGEKLGNIMHFFFVELGNFKKELHELGTFEEKVYFCLKSIGTLDSKPEDFTETFFEKLFSVTNIESLTQDQMKKYIRAMNSEEKRIRQIAGALEQGIEKGMKQGMEKGLEQGMKKGLEKGMEKGLEKGLEKGRELERTTIATNLLHLGISAKDIAAATSLSVDEIQTIASNLTDR